MICNLVMLLYFGGEIQVGMRAGCTLWMPDAVPGGLPAPGAGVLAGCFVADLHRLTPLLPCVSCRSSASRTLGTTTLARRPCRRTCKWSRWPRSPQGPAPPLCPTAAPQTRLPSERRRWRPACSLARCSRDSRAPPAAAPAGRRGGVNPYEAEFARLAEAGSAFASVEAPETRKELKSAQRQAAALNAGSWQA